MEAEDEEEAVPDCQKGQSFQSLPSDLVWSPIVISSPESEKNIWLVRIYLGGEAMNIENGERRYVVIRGAFSFTLTPILFVGYA